MKENKIKEIKEFLTDAADGDPIHTGWSEGFISGMSASGYITVEEEDELFTWLLSVDESEVI